METSGIRLRRRDGGEIFVDAIPAGRDSFRSDSLHHSPAAALKRVAELLGAAGWSPEQHGSAVADAVNLQRIQSLQTELDEAKTQIAKLRRGEFICQRCGIRKDGENELSPDF